MPQPITRAAALALASAALIATPANAARKPSAYPPARLWYRVAVDFAGDWKGTQPDPANHRFSERWTLHSNTAIRVSLMCQNRLVPDSEAHFIRRRIRGHRRPVRVGGCPAGRREGSARPTLRFAANARGEVTAYQNSFVGLGTNCADRHELQRLVSSQPLGGSISSPSTWAEGFVIRLRLEQPAATLHWHAGARECVKTTGPDIGSRYTEPAIDSDLLFGSAGQLVGDEGIADPQDRADGGTGWLPLEQFLRSGRRPPFGRAFKLTFRVAQAQVDPATYPAPPIPASHREKHYRYTIRFTPCPRHGLDVNHCSSRGRAG